MLLCPGTRSGEITKARNDAQRMSDCGRGFDYERRAALLEVQALGGEA